VLPTLPEGVPVRGVTSLELEKTGSSVDTLLDMPPFFDQTAYIVSSSRAVHLEYVSDSFSTKDRGKWSLAAYKKRRHKVVKQQAAKVSTPADNKIDTGTTESTDVQLSDDEGEAGPTEGSSCNEAKSGRRQSHYEQLVSLLVNQNEKCKKNRKTSETTGRNLINRMIKCAKHHQKKMVVANNLRHCAL